MSGPIGRFLPHVDLSSISPDPEVVIVTVALSLGVVGEVGKGVDVELLAVGVVTFLEGGLVL